MTSSDLTQSPIPLPIDSNANNGSRTNYYNGSIADRLVFSQRVTYGLLNNPQIISTMQPYGYDQYKRNHFASLYSAAADAHTRQQKEFGEKTGANKLFEPAFTKAKIELSNLVKVAKIALKYHQPLYDKLGLSGKKGGSIADIFTYMQRFYENLLNDEAIISLLTAYSYNRAKLENCRNLYITSRDLYNAYCIENAESMNATRIRDEKMAELNEWMYDYYALAKVAFRQRNEFTTEPPNNQ